MCTRTRGETCPERAVGRGSHSLYGSLVSGLSCTGFGCHEIFSAACERPAKKVVFIHTYSRRHRHHHHHHHRRRRRRRHLRRTIQYKTRSDETHTYIYTYIHTELDPPSARASTGSPIPGAFNPSSLPWVTDASSLTPAGPSTRLPR